jgi:hypothetical protein
MSRVFSTVAVLVLLAASSAAQSPGSPASSADDSMGIAMAHLDRSEYGEALSRFDKALDAYAAANRLDEIRQTYMRMFVGNRNHANVLMKAMTSWVAKRRAASGESLPSAPAEFDAWVQERAALAAATVNLAHNSPDWK